MTTSLDDRPHALNGLRILIADDEMMVAMSLEDLLTVSGCHVIKAGSLAKALDLARTECLNGALLDINLRGERVYPVATELDRRAIPFIFLTGYNAAHVEAPWGDRLVLEKPMAPDALERAIVATFTGEDITR